MPSEGGVPWEGTCLSVTPVNRLLARMGLAPASVGRFWIFIPLNKETCALCSLGSSYALGILIAQGMLSCIHPHDRQSCGPHTP